MFLNNSYFNVLRKIDSSWKERHSSRSREKGRYKFWKRSLSRSSSESTLKSHNHSNSFSSSGESGLYSGDVNSGYYGDDEIDPCPKCATDLPIGGARAEIDDYDVISIEVNVRKTRDKYSGKNCFQNPELQDFEEFVVIPSSREEFCSGNFRQSTPKKCHGTHKDRTFNSEEAGTMGHVFVTCTPRVTGSVPSSERDGPIQKHCDYGNHTSCSCISTPQKLIRFRLYAPPRCSNDTGVWWKENIKWQLRQRNKTQTESFTQLQEVRTSSAKSKVRINRELADYLNKYGEFRPHKDALNTAFVEAEPNVINQTEILDAIRSHGGKATRLRSNSVAQRAKAYMESKKEFSVKDTDEEDSGHAVEGMGRRSRSKSQYRDRLLVPRWRESVFNQLHMRNFLECKYFTDAIVRRTLSQLSISVSQTTSHSVEVLTDYDVITEDDVTRLETNTKAMNASQSISQGYHSSPPGAFTIRNLDLVYGKH
ncbi:uncharacterized protein LOC116300187 [Actinia tenebrosa]|uniref:Uncharacterized protein LOC116300187 n=1 Tax=Actinia tenebrosa TaxID=6105 RepID=A0A6P8IEW3_ACTTE|nr:uncharacterized protein LOC116300187 [Actinia tenebrosa]